jgi:hypothetical protein
VFAQLVAPVAATGLTTGAGSARSRGEARVRRASTVGKLRRHQHASRRNESSACSRLRFRLATQRVLNDLTHWRFGLATEAIYGLAVRSRKPKVRYSASGHRDASRPGCARRARETDGGEYDVNWPDWYAAYMVAAQAGTELPT